MSKPLKTFLIAFCALLLLAASAAGRLYCWMLEELFVFDVSRVVLAIRKETGTTPTSFEQIRQAALSGEHSMKHTPDEWAGFDRMSKPTMRLRQPKSSASKEPDLEIQFRWLLGGKYLITTDPPGQKRISLF